MKNKPCKFLGQVWRLSKGVRTPATEGCADTHACSHLQEPRTHEDSKNLAATASGVDNAGLKWGGQFRVTGRPDFQKGEEGYIPQGLRESMGHHKGPVPGIGGICTTPMAQPWPNG